MAPSALLLTALLLTAAPSDRGVSTTAPSRTRTVAPLQVEDPTPGAGRFDLRWRLPPVPADQPRDLAQRLGELAGSTWTPPVPSGAGERPLSSFADLVAAAWQHRHAPAAVEDLLERFAAEQPDVWRRDGSLLRELLREDGLWDAAWDPAEDGGRDGIAFGEAWSLDGVTREPWRSLRGSRRVQQAAVLVAADGAALKAAENDYAAYLDDPTADYEHIGPVPGTYLRGQDERGSPWASLQIVFECDLPFPFTSYRCELDILATLDEEQRLVTDVYSVSDDFHWLAGRDVWLPLHASDGAFVGTLVVRHFGFDLAGVPDGDEARRVGLRAGLGNLKRRAEARWHPQRDALAATAGGIPDFPVRGPLP